jgi:redox-sensing transcriptional repressor
MVKDNKIPDATIERIALYLRPLENLLDKGITVISSEKLASMCSVNPAQVRKDLSYFGEFGVRGVGYDVRDLLQVTKKILVSDREWRAGIAGLGNMGMALVRHENFLKRGYRFVAAFDSEPQRIGLILRNDLVVQPLSDLVPTAERMKIELGIITTDPSQAQAVSDMFAEAGVKAILNFSAIQLRQPECCLVENIDFTVHLDNLAYHLNKED